MPSKKDKTPLEPGKVYHIFNRGIDKAKLFISSEDYDHFIMKYIQYVSPYVNTYAICLIPNHFHIMVRVKENIRVKNLASEHLRRFFIVIAQRVNRKQNRKGSLFCKGFKRLVVEDIDYLKRLTYYIHSNPEKHGIIKDYKDYQYSTYSHVVFNKNWLIDAQEVVSWFGSLDDFLNYHAVVHDEIFLKKLTIED